MPEVFVKGQSLRQTLEVLREIFGEEATTRVVARLPEDFRRACQASGVLTSGWYPISWAVEIYRATAVVLPEVNDLPERVARRGVEHDMKGIYGFLARFVSPEFCIRQAPRILGTYFKGPTIGTEILGRGHAELYFARCDGFSRALWRDVLAGAARIFEQAGAKNVNIRFADGGRDGDTQARVVVRWD